MSFPTENLSYIYLCYILLRVFNGVGVLTTSNIAIHFGASTYIHSGTEILCLATETEGDGKTHLHTLQKWYQSLFFRFLVFILVSIQTMKNIENI